MSSDRQVNLGMELIKTLMAINEKTLEKLGITIQEAVNQNPQETLRGLFWPKDKEEAMRAANTVADKYNQAPTTCHDGQSIDEGYEPGE